jgi:hypothetical protein
LDTFFFSIVIYLITFMNAAVRALSVFLTVWLAAAPSLPTCCWSIVAASATESTAPATAEHHSHAHPAPDPHAGHTAHHQSTSDEGTIPVATTIGSRANDCAADRSVVVALAGTSVSFKHLHHTGAEAPLLTVPLAVGACRSLCFDDISPGTVSTASSFLSPLRI